MQRIAFITPLGGTGQTTLVANVCTALAQRGTATLGVDLCAQNGLALHLGLGQAPGAGWAHAALGHAWWATAALENSLDVGFLPFGQVAGSDLLTLDRWLLSQPDWLQRQISELDLPEPTCVVLDAPTWPAPAAQQALALADLVVIALEVSARACAAQEVVRHLVDALPATADYAIVLSRFDPRRDTQRQALLELQRQWRSDLAPYVVHEDESVPIARQQSRCVCDLEPASQAAHDLQGLAAWLTLRCGAASGRPS